MSNYNKNEAASNAASCPLVISTKCLTGPYLRTVCHLTTILPWPPFCVWLRYVPQPYYKEYGQYVKILAVKVRACYNNPIFMKKKQKINLLVIIAVIIIAGSGYAIFLSWQNQSATIESANQSASNVNESTNTSQPPRETLSKGEPDRLSIPGRDINDIPIIYVDEKTEEVYQDALAKGVVHYPDTAIPGEYGNPYIFGHSSDYFWKPGDYKEVLKPLIDIPLDTPIYITNHRGDQFVYRVIETKIVGPNDVSVLDQQQYQKKLLTLQTSWPIGTALKRYIAIAELDEEATYGPQENK